MKKEEEAYDDFYVDEQEEFTQNQPTIKTMQFNNAMFAPSKIDNSQYEPIDPKKLDISRVKSSGIKEDDQQIVRPSKIEVMGFNVNGTDTCILIHGKPCVAIGCVIWFDGSIYCKHKYEISSIKFDEKS